MRCTNHLLLFPLLVGLLWWARPTYAQATPCDSPANPVVAENCQPGTDEWQISNYSSAIEGFVSKDSAQPGDTVEFLVNTTASRFDLRVYRIGYYDGLGGRLIYSLDGLTGQQQPDCITNYQTGLTTCSNWNISHSLTIPDDWVSGIYLVKLIHGEDGGERFMTFVVRDDERDADILYQQSNTTYHAYNNYGGKSLYSSNSGRCDTVTQAPRAAMVSFNRPYSAAMTDPNFFFRAEYPMVYWLEAQGYDVVYSTNLDTHRSGVPGNANELLDHQVFLSVGHDEYWSQEMRDAITAARDAGVHIGVFSANTAYWRIRIEPDPVTGEADSVIVGYKSTEGGPADPISPTGTWRDPAGINDPENSLLGVQYIGDNDLLYFPLRVTAEQARHPFYRNTPLQEMPPGTVVTIGEEIFGWEWDAVEDNGGTPDGLEILAASPVAGKFLNDEGNFVNAVTGERVAHTTLYSAPSGAIVFSSGTIQWSWGLALVEPDPIIQQMTYNLLTDMGAQPATPDETLVLEGKEAPEFSSDALNFVDPEAPGLPEIRDIQVEVGGETATITWETDVETRGQVWFGAQPTVGHAPAASMNAVPGQQHAVTLDGLQPGSTYYYRILSVAPGGNIRWTDEASFYISGEFVHQAVDSIQLLTRDVFCWGRANLPVAAAGAGVFALVIGYSGWSWVRQQRRKKSGLTAART
jgi:hypothetical protein